jgi:hypothetical protein
MAVQIQKLNTAQRREVADFVDFLLVRRRQATREKSRRAMLAKVSVWSSDDIKPIEETMAEVNNWKLPNF